MVFSFFFLFLPTLSFLVANICLGGIKWRMMNISCRNGVKASGSPAQLTVFYAGAVHVYDEISPEKVHTDTE